MHFIIEVAETLVFTILWTFCFNWLDNRLRDCLHNLLTKKCRFKREITMKLVQQTITLIYHSISFGCGLWVLRNSMYSSVIGLFPILTRESYKRLSNILWNGYPYEHVLDKDFLYRQFYYANAGRWAFLLVQLITETNMKDQRIQCGRSSPQLLIKDEQYSPSKLQRAGVRNSRKKTSMKISEQRRFMVHHIVTVFLVVSSFVMNFVRIGHLIMIIMDISDILLAISKVN